MDISGTIYRARAVGVERREGKLVSSLRCSCRGNAARENRDFKAGLHLGGGGGIPYLCSLNDFNSKFAPITGL